METGNSLFSMVRLKELAVKMIEIGDSPLYAFKMMFYADFYAFKSLQRSITGSPYIRLDYGPVPDNFRALLASLKRDGRVVEKSGHTWTVNKKADMSLFDDEEKRVIEDIVSLVKKHGKSKVLELSHEEDAFKKTSPFHAVDYKLAATLKYPKAKR